VSAPRAGSCCVVSFPESGGPARRLPTWLGTVPPANVCLLRPRQAWWRDDLNPAIQFCCSKRRRSSTRPGIFHKAGEFPAPEALTVAERSGAPVHKTGRLFSASPTGLRSCPAAAGAADPILSLLILLRFARRVRLGDAPGSSGSTGAEASKTSWPRAIRQAT
jgi:hypothetical protein